MVSRLIPSAPISINHGKPPVPARKEPTVRLASMATPIRVATLGDAHDPENARWAADLAQELSAEAVTPAGTEMTDLRASSLSRLGDPPRPALCGFSPCCGK